MFRLFLDAYGYTVLTAETGAEGLEIFIKRKTGHRHHRHKNAGDRWIDRVTTDERY